ncbi:hypothetical protein ACFFQW_42900 [Umezawaea endophytica]|uniref:Uncharacterized protein n=1 Tax=Umezawaea endophytica TaxID=1654476 RepID=A0A9X2VT98_9PSEU|nr:hypothetical protein [Umezawaea endophytica]MCS7481163.1 hypothetical protein [Umezawaea endophytica]
MNDTQARIGRRAEGNRRVGRATAWTAAACTALATLFGVVFATGTTDAQSDTGTSTSTGSSTDGGDSLQAPDSAPEQGSGSAHTGSGGS